MRIARLDEREQLPGVADQTCEPLQQRYVFVGLRGNRHDQIRAFAVMPFDAFGQLQHGHAGAPDQMAIFLHAVRNRDAATQIGVRHFFAALQALDVGGLDITRSGQQLAGLGDRVVF